MKKVVFLLFSIINFISAQEIRKSIPVRAKSAEKTISGKLTGFQNGEKIKLYNPEIMKTLDSAYINNGNFKLKNPLGDVPETMFIIVNDELTYSAFIAGENIEISGDRKDFKFGLNIKGSKFQTEANILNDETKKYDIERDTLEKYFDDSDTSAAYLAIRKIKLERIDEIDKATKEIALDYIKKHGNTHFGLMYLSYYFEDFSKDEIQDFYNKSDKNIQQSVYGKTVKTYLEVGKILREGDNYFDFKAKGQDGKTHQLSEIKNKYILLDFNETYCGPCVASVSELKKVAVDYKDSLQIVSFCADKTQDIWKKGLKRDNPNWLSLWDGKGTQGPTVVKYNSDGFPTFILIDKAGIIVKVIKGYEKGILEKMLKENIKL